MPNGTYGGVRGGLNFTYSILSSESVAKQKRALLLSKTPFVFNLNSYSKVAVFFMPFWKRVV